VNTETWTPIRGYEKLYEITPNGQIRSWSFGPTRRRAKPRLLKWRINQNGYATVALANGPQNNVKNTTVHRLVALTFIPNPDNLPQINHKDFNKLNNSVENLHWCTHAQNLTHSWNAGNHKSPRGANAFHAKLKQHDIDAIKQLLSQNVSAYRIAKDFGLSTTHVYRIRDGKHWKPELPKS